MAHDVKSRLTELLQQALVSIAPTAADTPIHIERPRDPTHGDFATNLAMQLAKALRKNPREVARLLLAELPASGLVSKTEVAGAGFLNLSFRPAFWHSVVAAILKEGADYGRANLGRGERIDVEYVSANPTGPLHVGHGRGAVFGDALCNLLQFVGYEVTTIEQALSLAARGADFVETMAVRDLGIAMRARTSAIA